MHSQTRRTLCLALAIVAIAGNAARGHDEGGWDLLDSLPNSTPYQNLSGPYFAPVVPGYTSRPSAHAKIYLDFNGDTTDTWLTVSPGTTPAYDINGNPNTFSQTELDNIKEVWQRVSEKFSTWDIDVTTIDPGGPYNPYETAHVVIGGDGKNGTPNYWYGGTTAAGGISIVGGFMDPDPNSTTAFVFPANLGNGFPKYVAEASAHESGHLFGLLHQSTYSGMTKTNEYNPGTGTGPGSKAPIMGRSYDAERGLWWKGKSSLSFNSMQIDLDSIAGDTTGFDWRPDDHADTYDQADALALVGNALLGEGVIGYMTDKDFFKFTTDGGIYHFEVDPFSPGGMLDASLALYDSSGIRLLFSQTASLSESIDTTLGPGTYELSVYSAGNYGDVGQYTVGAYVPEPLSLGALSFVASLISLNRPRRRP